MMMLMMITFITDLYNIIIIAKYALLLEPTISGYKLLLCSLHFTFYFLLLLIPMLYQGNSS